MDALEVLQGYGDVAGQGMASVLGITQAIALLRDYITTTEAERDGAFGLLRIHGIPEERAVTIANGIEVLATRYQKSALDDAARIKELEEALADADEDICPISWCEWFDKTTPYNCSAECNGEPAIASCKKYEEVKKWKYSALSGARKVNSLGSVRGDEHLGAMLPDDGARKVER